METTPQAQSPWQRLDQAASNVVRAIRDDVVDEVEVARAWRDLRKLLPKTIRVYEDHLSGLAVYYDAEAFTPMDEMPGLQSYSLIQVANYVERVHPDGT